MVDLTCLELPSFAAGFTIFEELWSFFISMVLIWESEIVKFLLYKSVMNKLLKNISTQIIAFCFPNRVPALQAGAPENILQ